MTLAEFLAALNNPQAIVSVMDSDNTELIKLYAAGYTQLIAELLEREISKVTIATKDAVNVLLKEVDANEPAPEEPETDPDAGT